MKPGTVPQALMAIASSSFIFPTPFILRHPQGQAVAVYKDGDDEDVFVVMAYAMSNLMTISETLNHFQKVWLRLANADHPNHDIYRELNTYPGNKLIEDVVHFDTWPILSHETIENLWEHGLEPKQHTEGEEEVNQVNHRIALIEKNSLARGIKRLIDEIETGRLQVIQAHQGEWETNQLLKKAVLLYFKLHENQASIGWDQLQPGAYDKVPLRFVDWKVEQFEESKLRIAPNAIIRFGAYLGPNTLVMSGAFINIASHIGADSYIGPNSVIEACVYIGLGVTISAGAVIGDRLNSLDIIGPVIEDDVYIGKNSTISSGVIVRKGTIIADGVHIGPNTPLIAQDGRMIHSGEIPMNAIVLPGVAHGIICARIVSYRLLEATPLEALHNALTDVLAKGVN